MELFWICEDGVRLARSRRQKVSPHPGLSMLEQIKAYSASLPCDRAEFLRKETVLTGNVPLLNLLVHGSGFCHQKRASRDEQVVDDAVFSLIRDIRFSKIYMHKSG